jgi:hypothetical protein
MDGGAISTGQVRVELDVDLDVVFIPRNAGSGAPRGKCRVVRHRSIGVLYGDLRTSTQRRDGVRFSDVS